MYQVAVGSGSANLDGSDTQLDVEEYRADRTNSNVSIEDSSIDGRITIKISISGGTEVAANTAITEFGIFACDINNPPEDGTTDEDDVLLYRELRGGVTLESGDRKTFEIPYTIESQ